MTTTGAAGRGRALAWQAAAVLVIAAVVYAVLPAPARRTPAPSASPGAASESAAEEPVSDPSAAAQEVPGQLAAAGSARKPGSASPPRIESRRKATKRPGVFPEEELTDKIPPGTDMSKVTAAEYIEYLKAAGIDEGIAAFPPPGTKLPLEGNAVPEDVELPEGYIRHYQVTDDGQGIEPILLYDEDYEFFDENGRPIPIPDDRVVPADRMPPGIPIRPVEIPEPRADSGLGR